MAPLDLEFSSRFDARLRRQLLASVRFSLLTGAALFVVFAVWEATLEPSLLSWSAPVRLLIAGSLAALYGASFTALRRSTDVLFLLGTAVSGTGVIILGSRLPDGRVFVLASLLLLVPFVAVLASSMKAGLVGGALLLLAANVGALVMHSPPREFFMMHLFLVPAMGAAAGLASFTRGARERAFRLELALEHQAEHDALSGALNRAAFLLRAEAARASGRTASVLVLDVDHFKALNDGFGHAMGDEAIRRFAAAVKAEVRETDALGRLGGEEFAVLLPGLDQAAALVVAERVRAATAALVLSFEGRQTSMTVSVGVAQARSEEGLEALLHRADTALYASKHQGRNRVSLAALPRVAPLDRNLN
ncbi:MAG: GGDEF domain-containing protein [Archangium sp.]|nr:GGDEF domain-containing protein [Archangium sp.]